ncbi:MAG: polysaccharide deacetylase family protein [Candidatus Kapabacteria bacterium]|nr:polysaccharide deacetylase family protein [Candidatus Kapabacteria bacterium]
MNILHLISLTFVSGSEHFVVELANKQVELGHNVFIVSDEIHLKTTAHFYSQPITDRSIKNRKKNLKFLKEFVVKNNIQIVHCHSRSSNWLAHFALKKLKVAYLTSYHCRQGVHFTTKLIDTSGVYALPVCHNVAKHIGKDLKILKSKIKLLPNCIDFERLDLQINNISQKTNNQISIIGRTNSEKGQRTGEFLLHFGDFILSNFENFIIKIIGGSFSNFDSKVQNLIIDLNLKYNNRIVEVIYSNNLLQDILESNLVIGAGRVAIETLYLEKPLIAMGEKLFWGLVNDNNYTDALESNFGDIHLSYQFFKWDIEKVKNEIVSVINHSLSISTFKDKIKEQFDLKSIASQSIEFYRSAILTTLSKKHIPILMYHKITDSAIETKHQTYITKDNFKKHLDFFKSQKFTLITFVDLENFISGKTHQSLFPKKPLILTFDDGYKNNFKNLLPLMNEYGFKGVLYLLGDSSIEYNFWDADTGDHKDELMNSDERKEFVKAGWEIGAHSITHRNFTEISLDEVKEEIQESKYKLEQELNINIISFAYPTGLYNQEVIEITKASGIKYGTATDTGGLRIQNDFFRIFRASMFPQDKLFEIWKKTSSWYRDYYYKKRGK